MGGLAVIHVSGYDLLVEESGPNSNQNKSIFLSRNNPVAVVVGAAGFIGSYLVEKLLSMGVQVIGIDDFSTGRKENLTNAFKDKDFHFFHQSIEDDGIEDGLRDLPRLDYAIFVAENPSVSSLYRTGLPNFLKTVKTLKQKTAPFDEEDNKDSGKTGRPKVVFISSIQIYDNEPEKDLQFLKTAENQFAKFVKSNGLNGRVVRLAEVFGPRMHFRENEPVSRLIKACLEGKLRKEETALDFSTRCLFVEDAVALILRSVLSGSTSGKIYDGCLLQPIKVEEIKQILLNPDWHIEREFLPAELPPWPTPNLERSVKELSWKPKSHLVKSLKKTLSYFEEDQEAKEFALNQKKEIDEEKKVNGWTFSSSEKNDDQLKSTRKKGKKGIKPTFFGTIFLLVVVLGLFYPPVSFIFGVYALPASLQNSQLSVAAGDLAGAKRSLEYAHISSSQMNNLQTMVNFFNSSGLMGESKKISNLIIAQNMGVEGASQSLEGLEQNTKTFREGAGSADPNLFSNALAKLSTALAILDDDNLKNSALIPNKTQLLDVTSFEYFYNLAQKNRGVSLILPQIFENGEKNYLLLVGDSAILQPQGGKITQIGEIKIKKGSITLGELRPVSQIDQELRQNNIILSQKNLNSPAQLSNLSSADFPDFASTVKTIYQSLYKAPVDGVLKVDKSVIESLKNLTGLKTEENLLLSETFDRALMEENLFKTAQIFDQALTEKKAVIYSSDSRLGNIFTNLNWEGSIKAPIKEEGLVDYLLVSENNHSQAENGKILRKFSLATSLAADGGVTQVLTIDYTNNNPVSYLSTLQLVLPLGSKLNLSKVGESTTFFSSTVDFNRAFYTGEIRINPGSGKVSLEYSLTKKIEVGELGGNYVLKIDKQPGTESEPLLLQINYPFGWDLVSQTKGLDTTKHQVNIETKLDTDKTFEFLFKKQ